MPCRKRRHCTLATKLNWNHGPHEAVLAVCVVPLCSWNNTIDNTCCSSFAAGSDWFMPFVNCECHHYAVDGGGDTNDIHSQRFAPLFLSKTLTHSFGKQSLSNICSKQSCRTRFIFKNWLYKRGDLKKKHKAWWHPPRDGLPFTQWWSCRTMYILISLSLMSHQAFDFRPCKGPSNRDS